MPKSIVTTFFALALIISGGASAAAGAMPSLKEGVNYTKVVPAQPTDAKPGQVEVVEFFWYGCPHCYALEPYVRSWLKNKPKFIKFKRVPATLNKFWKPDARAFYVEKSLGILHKAHDAFFDAIHKNNRQDLMTDENAIAQFFTKYGVSAKTFKNTWDSFDLDTKVRHATAMAERYRIKGVPTIAINGKYLTGAGYQINESDIMKAATELAKREHRAEMGKK
jgi:thiol:disulfide interchange protein DsbA